MRWRFRMQELIEGRIISPTVADPATMPTKTREDQKRLRRARFKLAISSTQIDDLLRDGRSRAFRYIVLKPW
jgi:hypothetical protein